MIGTRYVALAAVLLASALAASCTTSSDSGNGNGGAGGSRSPGNSCEALPESEGSGWKVNAEARTGDGVELTLEKRLVAANDDGDALLTDTLVNADGELLMRILESWDAEQHEVTVEYGPRVPGLTMVTAVLEDGVLNGTVNGRDIVPMAIEVADPDEIEFEDGNPAPDPGTTPEIETGLSDLFQAASTAAQKCEGGDAEAASLLTAKRGDRGHVSLATFTSGCLGCKGACYGILAGCAAVAAAGCIAALIAYAACVIPAEAGCLIAFGSCLAICNMDGKPCCPVGCGDGCCLTEEICLNPSAELCCRQGQFSCFGNECCDNSEICFDSGPNVQTCCPVNDRCGEQCCIGGDICGVEEASLCCEAHQTGCIDRCCNEDNCINEGGQGLCCDTDNICGDSGSNQVCCAPLDTCVRGTTNYCCGFDSPPCGGGCCAVGETCLEGTNCCPPERVCPGNICCSEGSGCNLQTDTCVDCPLPGHHYCQQAGTCCANETPSNKTGTVCSPIPDLCCDAGELYCGQPGSCRPSAQCIL